MNPSFSASLLAATAALVAVVALGTGSFSALLASPAALVLAVLALRARLGARPGLSRRVVGAGLATVFLGAFLVLAGSVLGGLLVGLAGLGVVTCGSQFALELDPPPPGLALPSTVDPALNAAVALDEAVLLLWELTRFGRSLPNIDQVAAEVRAAAERNHEQGWLDRPELAHALPPPLEKPVVVSERVRGLGYVEHVTFASEFEARDPEVRESYAAFRPNRTAHVYLHRGGREPRPTLLMLHGYTMGNIAADTVLWKPAWFRRELPIDLAFVVAPLHGPRATGQSGAGFFDGHPLWTSAALGQAVWELRRISGWLREQGAPAIGVMGYSLGGYTAALFASLEERLACAIPVMPASDLAALVWRMLPKRQQDERRAAGLTPHLVGDAFARHSPLRMRPRVDHAARLVVGGLADRVVPPAQVAALWEHWGQPHFHWMPGPHLAWLERHAFHDALAAHLRRTLLA